MPHPFENCIPIFFNLSSRISGEVRGARLLPRRRPLPRRTVRRPGGMHQGGVPDQGRTQRRPRLDAVIVSGTHRHFPETSFQNNVPFSPVAGASDKSPPAAGLRRPPRRRTQSAAPPSSATTTTRKRRSSTLASQRSGRGRMRRRRR